MVLTLHVKQSPHTQQLHTEQLCLHNDPGLTGHPRSSRRAPYWSLNMTWITIAKKPLGWGERTILKICYCPYSKVQPRTLVMCVMVHTLKHAQLSDEVQKLLCVCSRHHTVLTQHTWCWHCMSNNPPTLNSFTHNRCLHNDRGLTGHPRASRRAPCWSLNMTWITIAKKPLGWGERTMSFKKGAKKTMRIRAIFGSDAWNFAHEDLFSCNNEIYRRFLIWMWFLRTLTSSAKCVDICQIDDTITRVLFCVLMDFNHIRCVFKYATGSFSAVKTDQDWQMSVSLFNMRSFLWNKWAKWA